MSIEHDPCEKCEDWMQPFLDRQLTEVERVRAEAHLDGCVYCRRRYRFEETLRIFVRKVCSEDMTPELKQKLSSLRTPL